MYDSVSTDTDNGYILKDTVSTNGIIPLISLMEDFVATKPLSALSLFVNSQQLVAPPADSKIFTG